MWPSGAQIISVLMTCYRMKNILRVEPSQQIETTKPQDTGILKIDRTEMHDKIIGTFIEREHYVL